MNVHGLGDRSDDDAERGMQAGEATALLCGEKIRVGTLKPLQYVLLCCCPCFLGPPCSSNRRTNYKNMMKTLAFMIVVVCLVMFVVELGVGGGVTTMKENPMLGPDALTLARLGSAYGWRTQTKGEVYRLFSPIFLHGGFFHILANMLFLVFLGVPLEQKWGWRVFGIVFFGSGIAASLFSTCIHPDSISVGASGALFGLLGASLADLLTHWSTIDASARKMQLFQQILTIVIWMMISFGVKYIDGWAHLGGLLYGFLIGCILWAPQSQSHVRIKTYGMPVAASITGGSLVLMGGLFFVGVIKTHQLDFLGGY